jgi:hypothetical protein
VLSYYKSTHTSGHTLDLILSRSINDVIITELESTLALSDHSFIECNLNIPKPNFVAKELRFRQLKRIDIPPMFKNDISGLNYVSIPFRILRSLHVVMIRLC